ncbi:cell division/cell wall cluster transcriptional repressor MraZ [Candidatus Berkelbacteria bacterium RIFCSPHIGHO2_12_FULL_36_9]|uniref:Transcriptional regulator MraZ n=1 Tax=Candidatus Berkelbacteria bacterium RIFCSPHIGHO2_12_FULL_36_9 TaxID=1797469 RepID=A0A1F5EF23_9BACT|nr:MAG: cell division/cell wall cluster transcriptional repressor MraZ [Candidatus Berkelbacteria bacterium RIFCSPHIGHO2_12_FULL_36_9]
MFIGEYSHSIDPKGRLAIPVKMRAKLDEGAVVTKGLDNCLFVYPREEWQKLAEKLSTLPLTDSKSRAFSRLMLAGAMEVEFDKQGRILLPGYLREFASLKFEAVVAGLYNRIEIWNAEAWKSFKAQSEQNTEEITEHLSQLGI